MIAPLQPTFSYPIYYILVLCGKPILKEYLRLRICSAFCNHNPGLSSFVTYRLVCNKSNTMGATSGAGTAYPSGTPEFTPGFQWGSCCSIISFLCSVQLIIVCLFSFVLSFFFLPITSLLSSNFSSFHRSVPAPSFYKHYQLSLVVLFLSGILLKYCTFQHQATVNNTDKAVLQPYTCTTTKCSIDSDHTINLERFEDVTRMTGSRNSKDRQYNEQKKKYKQ